MCSLVETIVSSFCCVFLVYASFLRLTRRHIYRPRLENARIFSAKASLFIVYFHSFNFTLSPQPDRSSFFSVNIICLIHGTVSRKLVLLSSNVSRGEKKTSRLIHFLIRLSGLQPRSLVFCVNILLYYPKTDMFALLLYTFILQLYLHFSQALLNNNKAKIL